MFNSWHVGWMASVSEAGRRRPLPFANAYAVSAAPYRLLAAIKGDGSAAAYSERCGWMQSGCLRIIHSVMLGMVSWCAVEVHLCREGPIVVLSSEYSGYLSCFIT